MTMNPNLNALHIAVLQCLASPDVTSEQITEVIRESIKTKMNEAQDTVQKSRTVLENLRIPHHYTTCPDYLTFSSSESDAEALMSLSMFSLYSTDRSVIFVLMSLIVSD